MGCDGGTIPKRKEVVKTKSKAASEKREVELMNKWGYCCASDRNLRFAGPIVASQMGDLMTKEGAIEHIIEVRRGDRKANYTIEDHPGLESLKSMKDFKELNLKKLTDEERKTREESSKEVFWADFVCPITGLEVNGKYTFVFSWQCGCVVSERAIKEVSGDKKCLVCQKAYEPDHDLVYLNPTTSKQIERNQAGLLIRKLKGSKKFQKLTGGLPRSSGTTSRHQDDSDDDDDDDLFGASTKKRGHTSSGRGAESSSSHWDRPGPSASNKRPRY